MLGEFLLSKKKDQRIYITFYVKNKIMCCNVLAMLTVEFGEFNLRKKRQMLTNDAVLQFSELCLNSDHICQAYIEISFMELLSYFKPCIK